MPTPVLCGSRSLQVDRSEIARHAQRKKAFEDGQVKTPPKPLPENGEPMRRHPYPHPQNHTWLTHIFEANLWLANGYEIFSHGSFSCHHDRDHPTNFFSEKLAHENVLSSSL